MVGLIDFLGSQFPLKLGFFSLKTLMSQWWTEVVKASSRENVWEVNVGVTC
jgi:hypothetical protein